MSVRRGGALPAELGIGMAFMVECAVFAFLSPHFLTAENLLNVSLQSSITAVIAAGMTLVILTGGIDLSVGSIVALGGILATDLLRLPLPLPAAFAAAILGGLLFGAASGAIAGFCIHRFRIAPFIVTLALMTIWRGTAFVYTGGRPIWELPEQFALLGAGRLMHVPFPAVLMGLVYAVVYVALTRTRFGRHVYAIGGNADAARLAGIRIGTVLVWVYSTSGALASLSGILLASRMNSGQPNAGLMYELDVIAAVVVGGTSLSGGRGSIVGTFIGAMLIAVLRNGLNLLNVSSYFQQVIVGIVILLAALFDQSRIRQCRLS